MIATLQDLGVRIAIDDVGAGHGGLSYILKLGVDIIKIDKMFVDALGSDNHSSTIIETLVDLAAEHAHGYHRRGRRDLRAGDRTAGTRHPHRAGLSCSRRRCRARHS